MTHRIRATATAAALVLAAPAAAKAPSWTVDHDASRVGFTAWQSGEPVSGRFTDFDAAIRFAPDQLETSRVGVTIRVASVDTGSADRDDTITSAKLFHAGKFPTARFVAESFSHKNGNTYVAHGKLTMRGTTHPVDLPFTLDIATRDGTRRAVVDGEVEVKRLRWGIGKGVWRNTGMVPNTVRVEIKIVATRPAGG